MLGIKENFKTSKRLICSWHFQRNLQSKFSSLIHTQKQLYNELINLPFITSEEKFEEVVSKLKVENILSESQRAYLERKLEEKNLWAKSANKKNFIVGVCTTSRIESMHRVLRDSLNSSSRLLKVFEVFKKIEETEIKHFQNEFARHKKILMLHLHQDN